MNKNFVIYGERNSGTNYLETILTGRSYHIDYHIRAFDIPVVNKSHGDNIDNIFGDKHFFGFHDEHIKKANNTIFIAIVRNPYDWIVALHNSKHHIPPDNHDIVNFLTNEWYSIKTDINHKNYGKEFIGDRNFNSINSQDNSLPKRYKNIFEMRSCKINFLYHKLKQMAKNYEFIKYEDLCFDPWSIVTEWALKYNLPLNMPILEPIDKQPYQIESKIKEIIDNNIDWEIENQIGYFRK